MPTSPYEKSALFIEDQLTIINKSNQEVPFILNSIQKKFTQEATGKDIILKARQQGFSSLILGAFAKDFILSQNSLSVVIADNANNAQDLLSRVKHYIQSFGTNNECKVPLKYNSKYELQNAANNARYIIGTAENVDFGRSKTITNLHFSEPAFYGHLQQLIAGATSAVTPTGRIVLETTANGFDYFKTFYDSSVLGETGFTPHFYPAQDFYTPEYLAERKKALGRLYDQEFPSSAEVAFVTSGETYFDTDAMRYYLENAKEPLAL
jgi:hypothetical protein